MPATPAGAEEGKTDDQWEPPSQSERISQKQRYGRERQVREWKKVIPTPTTDSNKTLWRRETGRWGKESDNNCSNKQLPSLQAWMKFKTCAWRTHTKWNTDIEKKPQLQGDGKPISSLGEWTVHEGSKPTPKGKAPRPNKGKGTVARDVGWFKHKPKQKEGSDRGGRNSFQETVTKHWSLWWERM